ncbi:hypothetical protein L2E82_28050 [Cichorium intybus]|uniref:Uncharacterized protein n=1 Tax=Cichorium intybus TaxID=13427 RepID=A0ACB9CUR7_CICIN|nr:hypothetical protein L2E82_28050 [Cichorium intybus]
MQLVDDLPNQNVAPRDILSILKEHDENNVSTLKTIYNARLKLRLSQNVGKTPMQILMGHLNDKQFLIEFSVNENSNELENLFFVHPRSLDMWRAFPHVIIIDATYKTNKYAVAVCLGHDEDRFGWCWIIITSSLEGLVISIPNDIRKSDQETQNAQELLVRKILERE